jgi:hypothetical protein
MLNLELQAPKLPTDYLRMISTQQENLKLKLQSNSLYLSACLKDPLTLQDICKDNQSLLIDSGATKNFVDEHEAKRLQLPTEKLKQPIRVTLIDGNESVAGMITHTTTLQLQFDDGTEQTEKFYLTKIDEEHPWVLGYDWLKRRNPKINWSEPSIKLDRNHEKARVIRLFGAREKPNKEMSEEEHLQRIQSQKRNNNIPIFGHTTRQQNTSKVTIVPKRRPEGYVQNLRAHRFLKLAEEEKLPITILHICTATSEKGN